MKNIILSCLLIISLTSCATYEVKKSFDYSIKAIPKEDFDLVFEIPIKIDTLLVDY